MDSIRNVKIERRKFDSNERKIILSKTNGKCAHCGKKLEVYDMTVDHVFPMDKGGLHDEYNLLPLCYDCNEEKSNFVYSLSDYYKHIDKKYKDLFYKYFTYASFEWSNRTILGFDEKLFWFLSDKGQEIVDQMRARKAKQNKIDKAIDTLAVSISLRKAYPANAEAILNLINTSIKTDAYFIKDCIYKTEYDVLRAIEKGVVYILEKNKSICGVFMFEYYKNIIPNPDFNQLTNILEQTNLKLKYVMTYATCNNFGYPVFSDVMEQLNSSQLSNGWMPLYFNILSNVYRDKDKCIRIPYTVNDVPGSFEFMTLPEIIDKENMYSEAIFDEEGYNADEYDIRTFSEYLVKYRYQSELTEPEVEEFFKKYPKLLIFFKPESYEYYDVGFITDVSDLK